MAMRVKGRGMEAVHHLFSSEGLSTKLVEQLELSRFRFGPEVYVHTKC
jgi:hypothetical protein